LSVHNPEQWDSPVQDLATDEQYLSIGGITAYINAGGRGTRLNSIFHPHKQRGVSKALLPVGEPPISLIEHQINKLDHAGVSTIVAGVGNHENVAEYIRVQYPGRSNLHTIIYDK
jgi:NDP-sugar pyrophosphorylase family protein